MAAQVKRSESNGCCRFRSACTDVGVEREVHAQEMRAVGEPGQRRRVDLIRLIPGAWLTNWLLGHSGVRQTAREPAKAGLQEK